MAPFLRRPDRRAVLYFGVLWPDLLSKGIAVVLKATPGFGIPSHSIVGLAVASAAAALLFRRGERVVAWSLLMAGSMLHLAGDLLKDYGVYSGIRILHPFSDRGYSLGLFRSEDFAYALPAAAVLFVLIEWIVRRKEAARGT